MKITKTQLREIIRKEIQKLNDAVKYDIMAALKDIREFNRGHLTLDDTVMSIVRNLGYKTNHYNVNQAKDHLGASSRSSKKLPEDADVVRELYGILK